MSIRFPAGGAHPQDEALVADEGRGLSHSEPAAGRILQAGPRLYSRRSPSRTPEHLKEYMPLFHPRFVGLTGDAFAVRAAARAYRVYYKKVEWDDRTGYTVDHSAFIYLMGRDGEYLGFFPPGTSAQRLVEAIRRHLAANR